MRKVTILYWTFSFVTILSCTSQQKSMGLTPEQISQSLQKQEYQFLATFVQPVGGRQRNLTGSYTLNVSKAEIVADLPYFGKVYNAQIGSTDGGIKFQSKEFSYAMEPGKKGSQEIRIKTKDVPETLELYLTVYDNGSANLRVNSVNRQSISYTGEIRSLPQPK